MRAVLDVWIEVQRSWCSLEAIFLGSEDIREQLPEDAKRFDGIDAAFKEQMGDASQNAEPDRGLPQEAATRPSPTPCRARAVPTVALRLPRGQEEEVPALLLHLAVDLVDILSKGTHPPAVQEHFSKFTDNTGAIDWAKDDETGKTRRCAGCRTDKERRALPRRLRVRGRRRGVADRAHGTHQATVRDKLESAIDAYVEMPRDEVARHVLRAALHHRRARSGGRPR